MTTDVDMYVATCQQCNLNKRAQSSRASKFQAGYPGDQVRLDIQCTPNISQSCISRNWIYHSCMLDTIFWRPRAPWTQFAGDNFSRNLLTAIAFVPSSQETIFHEINSSLPVSAGWNTCCAMVSQDGQSIDTSIVLQSRVQLIQCQCKLRLQIPNLCINNAF